MASSDDVNALSEAAVCYLCLDGGSDETDQPLPRDCACRGTVPDLFIFHALLNMRQSKVCRLVIFTNSLRRDTANVLLYLMMDERRCQ